MYKRISNTYIYQYYNNDYRQQLLNFTINGTVIDTSSEQFAGIAYDIKNTNLSDSIYNILKSENLRLVISNEEMPTYLKVIMAKDKTGKYRIFIDVTNLLILKDGVYKCSNLDNLCAYLINAATQFIYYNSKDTTRINGNTALYTEAAYCFAALFDNVIEYLFKINSVPAIKQKCIYLAVVYFLTNIMEKGFNNNMVRVTARKIAGISELEEKIIRSRLDIDGSNFNDIKTFIETIAEILALPKLNVSNFIYRWMQMYKPSTLFALENFSAFSKMLTDAYVGTYLNNRKSIEKICGGHLIEYTKRLLSILSDSL